MTKYLLSIDPGWSTGVAFLRYDSESVYLERAWQFSEGVAGLLDWDESSPRLWRYPGVEIIVEKFTPRPNENFSLTMRAVEPLVCEGALIANGYIQPYETSRRHWRQPKDQYIVGGKDKIEKKKRLHAFLKDTEEFYVTGKPLGQPNADDARSAIGHGLGYIARVEKHRPLLAQMSEWSDKNG